MTTWRRVVCDEVHILRNSRSARSRAACLLRSKRRWGLSGTPVMNRWSELYALVRYVKLPFVSDPREFKHHLLVPIKRNDPAGYSRLQEIVRYFLLRRTKSILDLPPKEETIEYVTLAGEEQKLYDAVFHKTQLVFQKFLRRGLVLKEYMYFLQQILRLRQIACHPLLATSSEGATRSRRNEDDEETRRARRAARTLWLALKDRSVSSVASLARMQDLARLAVGVCKQLEATMTDCVVCLLPLRREKMEHAFVPKCQHFLCPECMALQRQSGSRHVTCPASGCSEVVDLETVFSVDFESLANAFGDKPIVNASSPAPRQERTMEEKAACKEEVIDSSVYDGGDDREMLRTGLLRYVRNKVFKQHLDVESASGDPFENIRDPETHMLFSSAKVRRLLGLLQEYAAEEAKTVVFSQWTSMLDLISPLLIERGLRFVRLDGSMRLDERTAAIKQFSTGKTDIFLVSLGAGAVGLNLVAATKVVLMDFWWNPFVSEQAIDRVHRLGQTKPVTVVHLAARNTIEVNILELQQQKKDMARGVLCMTSPEELAQRKLNELKLLFSVPGREADAKAKEPAPESSSTSSVASTATAPVAGGATEPTASWTTATIPAPAEELGVPVAAASAPTANDLEHYLAAQSEWMARMMDAISSMVMPRE
ncbi:SNF2 family domain-containing protein [Thecamonas trahens ATCC 50062]|uniref:SNF2 family domain-containing protein n=1 Tax=Thecamonas trahens ATCC 50062 TaxID=461836 RepID=A0A0L0DUS9_THETB|nr:SNF2 family domain-containing protein [Thecamonas trahens ATCC 50062]KNC55263.1 SNF2 family domain-containing protein [Thecamonas trahens ATCC 50062]|eukprot:XP_013753086.1 SNF2 family domain-containing protein [Thecamonas trahens ATCC 50062]